MSNLIRRSSKDIQDTKANEFPIQDDEGNDWVPLLLGHLQHHIRDRFPVLSDGVLERPANSMLLRRKRILYRRSRQRKKPIKLEGPVQMETITLPTAAPDTITLPAKKPPISNPGLTGEIIVHSQTNTATILAPETFQRVSYA